MQKRHTAPVRAGNRVRVDQAISLRLQRLEVRLDVVHPETDVVNAFAAPLDEPGDGGVGTGRLEQLQTSIAYGEEGGADVLGLHRLALLDGQADILIDSGCG